MPSEQGRVLTATNGQAHKVHQDGGRDYHQSGSGMPSRYVLRCSDGRMATYDTAAGPTLTGNKALCYVWTDAQEAESQRPLYEQAFDVSLAVETL